MPQDTYGFRQIRMYQTQYVEAEPDLVSKSAYYWGKVLNCRFATNAAARGVEVTRLPTLYRTREHVRFDKFYLGFQFDLATQDDNADRNFLRYHAGKLGFQIQTELRYGTNNKRFLTCKVLDKSSDSSYIEQDRLPRDSDELVHHRL